MIKMDEYEYVRTAHRVYGKGIREIERETGHDRKTIRKALSGEYGGYTKRERQPYPVLGPHLETIERWIAEDVEAPKKQRHTAVRIYRRLVNEEGYRGAETTVRQYVREAKLRLGLGGEQAFIPLDPDCGREGEVDWGNAWAEISRAKAQLKYFCMRSRFSGKHFVRFYPCERQQAFFDGHMRGFEFFGGVFRVLVYDNLTSAVRKVLEGHRRVEQDAFRRFRGYYNFEPRFCNLDQGHEKGGVEGLVGFARRNYMVPIPKAESLEALNERILSECVAYGDHRLCGRDRTVDELFSEERSHLLDLPPEHFANEMLVDSKVSPYATVMIDRNRYSVPSSYVGRRTRAHVSVNEIEIFHDGKRIARHPRLYSDNRWQLDADHYLDLLYRRPGAFDSARPIREWRKSWPESLEMFLASLVSKQGETAGVKEFISVLMLCRDHEQKQVERAVEVALEHGLMNCAAVKQILLGLEPSPSFERLESWPRIEQPDVSIYGRLGGVS